MSTTKISKNEYLRLEGLLQIARDKYKFLKEVEESIADLLGVQGDGYAYFGHVSDAIWGEDLSAKALLSNLDIEVVEKDAQ